MKLSIERLLLRRSLQYWTKKFGVTPDQLRQAVRRVGTSAAKVEQELKRR